MPLESKNLGGFEDEVREVVMIGDGAAGGFYFPENKDVVNGEDTLGVGEDEGVEASDSGRRGLG